jgi:hypothetical protein
MDLLIEIVVDVLFSILLEYPIVSASLTALGLGLLAFEGWPYTGDQIRLVIYTVAAAFLLIGGLWFYRECRNRPLSD